MKKLVQLVVIAMLLPPLARAANDNAPPPPPPPPNPFSNLPSGGSEGFTPFDDDFDDAGNAAGGGGSKAGGGGKGAVGFPAANGGAGGAMGGAGMVAEGGSQQRLAPPASCKEPVDNFDYPDAEILDVAKAIGKLTGRNFIYNPQDIKGRISVVSQTQITVCDAWNAFLTALNLRGFALVPSGKYLRIERIANAKEKQTPIYADKKIPNNDEFITRVLPLRYIDATEFESAFRLWMPREARMQAYQQTNTIIITDTAAHINRMVELISLLDVAGYQESLVVVPIHNAAAKDIAKLIDNILRDGASSAGAGGFGMPQRPVNPYGAPSSRGKGRSGGSTISKIIADDRTNCLIVKANAAGILEIRALVRRLDTKVATAEGSGRIHVVSLRFANAEDLGKVLQQLTGGGSGSRNSRNGFPSFGEPPPTFQSEIKVAPDKTTQSLVITASPQDFITMKKVIERLDQPRDQVYLEAMILEMTINRGNAFGVSFFNSVNGLALNSSTNNLQNMLLGTLPSGFVVGYKSGMSHTATDPTSGKSVNISSFQGLFELIQSNADSQVLATPQIIALDNEKATFEVKDTVPVQQTTLSNGIATTSFQSDSATLKLEVTPQINKGSNFVKLEIAQQMEAFDNSQVPQELLGKANGKNTRSTTTKVFLQSDDTVVLSGMIRSTVQETVNKVPLLGDIPVLGWLFKNSKKTNIKTNLLVFVTPHIIKQYDKIRKILADKLSERDDFVRETQGSIDPFGREINKLKRNLPDLTVIEPMPQGNGPMDSQSFQGPSGPDRDDEEGGGYDQQYYDPYNGQVPLPPVEAVPPPQINEGMPPPVVAPQDNGVIGQ
jgi:general secretion pathway protein D